MEVRTGKQEQQTRRIGCLMGWIMADKTQEEVEM